MTNRDFFLLWSVPIPATANSPTKVFNDYPTLAPGAVFSCSGCHEFDSPPVSMELRLFGNDELGTPFISAPLHFPKSCFQR